MKYLKRFNEANFDPSFQIGTKEYELKVKNSHSLFETRKQIVQSIVDLMIPKPEIICEEIIDISESWKDEGIEFENIELVTLTKKNFLGLSEIEVYYPLGFDMGKNYHPNFGSIDVDSYIIGLLEKNNQLYYSITFGIDILDRAKAITGSTYYSQIDWDSKELDPLYNTMKEASTELWERLHSMYNIECIASRCFIRGERWKDCDPTLSDIKTGKLTWVLKIND